MKRYAFIDVPNTSGSTRECHDFYIDWSRLYNNVLKNDKWKCEDVFFYKGHKGKTQEKQLEKIREMGYVVRTKRTHIHPDKEIIYSKRCKKCDSLVEYKHTIKGNHKSNCDVELTVDALNKLSPADEAILFTGDGDFSYLIEDLICKGIKVWIVFTTARDGNGVKRFSTRLKEILKREERGLGRVNFININDWRNMIIKG